MPSADHGCRKSSARVRPSASWAAALCLVALSGCKANHLSDGFLRRYATPDPVYTSFFQCHGFGCTFVAHIELTPDEWQSVRAVFVPPAGDARGERRQIATAIALLERLVGARTGTAAHQWTRHNGHIDGNPQLDPTQLDCIDEAVNTWTYLTMLARDGLLRNHRVEKLAYAGGLPDFNGAPRNAAVIREIASGTYLAIDPTLVDAGETPPILPLATWLGHWPPPLSAGDEAN